jgi:hypothetical protein
VGAVRAAPRCRVGAGTDTKVRDVFLGLGLVAVCLALIAGAVFGLDDEALFVAPPEIVAEQFVEALALGRAGPARRLLERKAERGTSIGELRRVSDSVRHRYGTVHDLRGTVESRTGDTVTLRVVVKGSRADGEVRLPAVREQGQWAVARPNELLPTAGEPATR